MSRPTVAEKVRMFSEMHPTNENKNPAGRDKGVLIKLESNTQLTARLANKENGVKWVCKHEKNYKPPSDMTAKNFCFHVAAAVAKDLPQEESGTDVQIAEAKMTPPGYNASLDPSVLKQWRQTVEEIAKKSEVVILKKANYLVSNFVAPRNGDMLVCMVDCVSTPSQLKAAKLPINPTQRNQIAHDLTHGNVEVVERAVDKAVGDPKKNALGLRKTGLGKW
jgi:hypothetical protein